MAAHVDRGLAYIRYTDGLSYYRSSDNGAGAVYAATLWHGNLLIGTNQGIYYAPQEKMNDFDLFSAEVNSRYVGKYGSFNK